MRITGYRTLTTVHDWGRPVGDANGVYADGLVRVPIVVVETDVPEARLHLVKAGTPCEIVLDAYPARRYRGVTEELGKRINRAKATVVAKVGPVQAKFNGNVTLSNLNPPESYTISGEGKGGAAGFAKGGADVRLLEDGEVTVLTYTAKADVGGKLAQLGSRLIDGTAKKLADEFFDNFSRQVAGPLPAAAPVPEEVVEAAPPAPPESLLQNKFVWAA